MGVGDSAAIGLSVFLLILLVFVGFPASVLYWQVYLKKAITGANWIPMMLFAFYILFILVAIVLVIVTSVSRNYNEKTMKEFALKEEKAKTECDKRVTVASTRR